MTGETTGFWGRTSIQARVRTALVGVLLLTVPQVALTLNYLSQLSKAANSVHQRVALVEKLTNLSVQAAALETSAEAALRVVPEPESSRLLKQWVVDIQALDPKYPDAQLSGLVQAAEAIEAQWAQATTDAAAAAAAAEEETTDAGQPPPTVESAPSLDWAPVRHAFRAALAEANSALLNQDSAVREIFNKASRNLVSLTILAFIFVAALIVVLPGRLVRPLRHITDVIRQAADGKYGVNVEIHSRDEVGQLAHAFQRTMLRIRDFDERKKDRIVEDGAKIDALIRHMPMAAAILNRQYVIEAANTSFRTLFELTGQDVDTPWPDGFSEGSDSIRQVLDSVVNHREALDRQIVTVHSSDQALSLEMTVDYCRDRVGKVGFVLVLIHGTEPKD